MKSTDASPQKIITIVVFFIGALYFGFVKAKDALYQSAYDPRLENLFLFGN